MVWAYILSYNIAIFSRDKIKTYKLSRKYDHMVHKKEGGTYHPIENLMKEKPGFLSPGKRLASPLNSSIFRN